MIGRPRARLGRFLERAASREPYAVKAQACSEGVGRDAPCAAGGTTADRSSKTAGASAWAWMTRPHGRRVGGRPAQSPQHDADTTDQAPAPSMALFSGFAHSNAGIHTTASAPREITCTRVKDQACTVTSIGLLLSRLRRSTICEIQEPRGAPPRRMDDDTAHGVEHIIFISSCSYPHVHILMAHACARHARRHSGAVGHFRQPSTWSHIS